MAQGFYKFYVNGFMGERERKIERDGRKELRGYREKSCTDSIIHFDNNEYIEMNLVKAELKLLLK